MSRSDVHGAVCALEGLADGLDYGGHEAVAMRLRAVVEMLRRDLEDRDVEAERSRRRRRAVLSPDSSGALPSAEPSSETMRIRPPVETVDRPPVESRSRPPNDHRSKPDLTGNRPLVAGGVGGGVFSDHEISPKIAHSVSGGAGGAEPTALPPTPRTIDPKLTLDAESRAYAEQVGVRDVDVEWQRFKDSQIAKGTLAVDFRARFRQFCPGIRNEQRMQRQREEAMPKPAQPTGDPQRAHLETAKRLAEQRREYPSKPTAPPMPMSQLMAQARAKMGGEK